MPILGRVSRILLSRIIALDTQAEICQHLELPVVTKQLNCPPRKSNEYWGLNLFEMSYQSRFVIKQACINPLVSATIELEAILVASDMRGTWGGNVTCDNDWGEASDLGPWWDGVISISSYLRLSPPRKMWPEVWVWEETNQGQELWDGSNQCWVLGQLACVCRCQFSMTVSGHPPEASDPLWRQ